jgi:hypothetical protein
MGFTPPCYPRHSLVLDGPLMYNFCKIHNYSNRRCLTAGENAINSNHSLQNAAADVFRISTAFHILCICIHDLYALAHGQALAEGGTEAFKWQQEPTGLPLETLQWVGTSICNIPQGFEVHKAIAARMDCRR